MNHLRLMLLFSLAMPAFSQTGTNTPQPCILGYTVAFFNGVNNSQLEALTTLNQLQQSIHEATGKVDDTFSSEDVAYQLYYNSTGSTVKSTWFQDLAETFIQRQNEIDPTGYFSANHLYMMWEGINGGGSNNYLSYANRAAGFGDFLDTITSSIVTQAVSNLGALLYNPPTAADYSTQNAQLDAVASNGRKMLLIAHSQGNLFVNHGYDYIQPKVGSTRVKVVHVAPASPTLRGQWILSSNDLIINGVRTLGGPGSVVDNNITIAGTLSEPTGHSMGPTYLDTTPGRNNGRAQVEALEVAALQALTAPSGCNVKVSPSTPTLAPGVTQTFTATLDPAPADPVLLTNYVWSISGTAGGTFAGGATTATTSIPSISYSVATNPPAGSTDTVAVKVYASKTQGDQVNAVTLGNGAAQVSVANAKVVISPNGTSINTGGSQALTATLAGSPIPALSFRWSVSGTYGTLTDVLSGKAGQTDYCTTGSAAMYIGSINSGIPVGTSKLDNISVQAYSDTTCGNAIASGFAAIFITSQKDLTPWIANYSCVATADRSTYNLTILGRPFPTGTAYGSAPGGTDLMYLQTNPRNTVQSYGYMTVDNTVPTRAFDSRYTTYNDAYNGHFSVYNLSANTLTWAFGSDTYLSCTR
jgi:hypothetical protein